MNWKNPFKKNRYNLNQNNDNKSVKKEEIDDFYDISPIDNTNAVYRVIIGQRSNRQDIQLLQAHHRELFN